MGTFSCYRWSIAIGLLVVRYVVLVVFLSYHEQHTQIVSAAAWVSSSSSSSLLLTNSKSIDVSRSTIHNFRSHHNHNRRLRSQQHPHQRTFGMHNPPITKTSLFYSSAFGRNDQQNEETSNNSTTITTSILERLQVNGISVSPKGFHLLMEASGGGRDEQEQQQQQRKELVELSDDNDNDNNNSNNNDDRNKLDNDMELQQTRDSSSTDDDCGGTTVSAACRRVVPLKMTNDPADTYQATSPESLTLCQLLSGVDMAGAILPPELLGKIVVYHIEEKYSNYNYNHDDDHEEEESGIIDHDLTTTTTTTSRLSATEQKVRQFIQEQQVLLEEKYSSESSSSNFLSSSLSSPLSYKDAHPWLQSRIRLPQVTLDQLTLAPAPASSTNDEDEDNGYNTTTTSNNDGKDGNIITTAPPSTTTWRCRLECALPEWNDRLVVDIKPDLLASLVYNYDPESSPLFTCVALALRYKAPIVLEQQQQTQQSSLGQLPSQKEEGNDESNNQDALNDTTTYVDSSSSGSGSSNTATATYWSRDELDRDFPQRLGVRSLQQQSTRVTENIERGFEIHKLSGALQIAKRLGDEAAAVQIRAKLDDYDSMKDLPTIVSRTHSSSSCSNHEQDGEDNNEEKDNDGDGHDRLVDDLDKNILQ